MTELKLGGIVLKRPMLRTPCEQNKETGKTILSIFIAINFYALNDNGKNPFTKPYIICVMQQRFSLVSLGWLYMW